MEDKLMIDKLKNFNDPLLTLNSAIHAAIRVGYEEHFIHRDYKGTIELLTIAEKLTSLYQQLNYLNEVRLPNWFKFNSPIERIMKENLEGAIE